MSNNKYMIINQIANEISSISPFNNVCDYENVLSTNNNVNILLRKLFSETKGNKVNLDFLSDDEINKNVKDLVIYYVEKNNFDIDLEEVKDKQDDSYDSYLSENQITDYLREIDKIPLFTDEEKAEIFPRHKRIRELNKDYRYKIISCYFDILKDVANIFARKRLSYDFLLLVEIDLVEKDIKNERFITDRDKLKSYLIKEIDKFLSEKKASRKITYDFNIFEHKNISLDLANELYKKHISNFRLEKEIRNVIVSHNMRFVVKKANEFKNKYPFLNLMDLIQDGMEGLINILDNDYNYEISSLMTYAYDGLDLKLSRIAEKEGTMVKISSNMKLKINKYNRFLSQYYEKYHKYPSKEEISNGLGITEDKLNEIISANNSKQLVSLDEPIKSLDDEDCVIADLITDEKSNVEKETIDSIVYDQLLGLLDILDDITKAVIMSRTGFVPKESMVIRKEKGISIFSNHTMNTSEINSFLNDNKLDYEIYDKLKNKNDSRIKIIRPNVRYIELERDKVTSLVELGELLYITRERVRQIELKGLKILRDKKKLDLQYLLK